LLACQKRYCWQSTGFMYFASSNDGVPRCVGAAVGATVAVVGVPVRRVEGWTVGTLEMASVGATVAVVGVPVRRVEGWTVGTLEMASGVGLGVGLGVGAAFTQFP